jgi:hypothetical protein
VKTGLALIALTLTATAGATVPDLDAVKAFSVTVAAEACHKLGHAWMLRLSSENAKTPITYLCLDSEAPGSISVRAVLERKPQ